MVLKVARRAAIPPFLVMDVMRAANVRQSTAGDVIHLEVGQPATSAPKGVLEAARKAMESDVLGYTDALGLPEIRTAIANHYRRVYGVDLDSDRIVVTTGASGGFVLAFLAAFEVGDRVALATPGYPAYRNILSALGVECLDLRIGARTGFQLAIDQVAEVADEIAGLIIASPSNPTGTMLGADKFAALARLCAERRIRLVSDEIYHGISFTEPAATAAALNADAVIVNSFSKYFSMTGWRIGWMVIPPEFVRPIECLAQNLFIAPPTLSQHAALAAFDCGKELDANVARYAQNREILLSGLPVAGFDSLAPADGAFYLYADVSGLTDDSQTFCRLMLAETGVAATPGVDFDPEHGRRFVRFCFAGGRDEIAEACRRLQHWRR